MVQAAKRVRSSRSQWVRRTASWLELSVSPSIVDYGGETQIAWSAAQRR